MRPSRWSVLVATVAVSISVCSFRAPQAPAASATADAKSFVTALNRAFAHGDIQYLLRHLHPAVIDRYGSSQCRSYLAVLVRQPPHLKATAFASPGDYEYASDGVSTTVPGVMTVSVSVTVAGRAPTRSTVHVTRTQWFTDCGSPIGPAAALATASSIAGHYAGSWHNDTFGTSGSVTLDLAVDATAMALKASLTLGGNVFGGTAPPPQTITIPLDPAHTSGPVTATTSLLGPVTMILQDDGSIVADAPSVPGGVVGKLHASLSRTATGYTGTYTLTAASSSATATGTITVTKS